MSVRGRRGIQLVVAMATVAVAACSTMGSSVGSRDVITRAELDAAGLDGTYAWEAVQRMRPNWLRSRTTTTSSQRVHAVVFVDGARFGGLDVLRSIRVQNLAEVRYLGPQDATTRYGTGYLGGVIEVVHRR